MAIYSWPGNVRELLHSVEQAVVRCKGSVIDSIQFAGEAIAKAEQQEAISVDDLLEMDMKSMRDEVLWRYEREYLDRMLSSESGSIDRVAKRCGIDRKTLYRKMKQYQLNKKDYR